MRTNLLMIVSASCLQYGSNVYACDGETTGLQRVTVWSIYVGREP